MVGVLLQSSTDVNHSDNGLFPAAKGKPQLDDSRQCILSTGQVPVRDLQSRKSLEQEIGDIDWPRDVKLDRVVESAWAILLSWYGEATDTVFDVVLPVSKVEQLPQSRTVAVFVEEDMTLSAIQHQMTLTGLAGSSTTQRAGKEARLGWQSKSLLMIQPTFDERLELDMYAVTLHCEVKDSSLLTKMDFDSTVLSEQVALRVMEHFGHILRQICRADMTSTRISDLDAMTAKDLQQVWTWNAKVPEEADACVHDIFSQSVSKYPHQTAISAWDGELTYTQWDALSTQLAYRLVHRGVRPGHVLPLIFEKSMWVAVSQFAVMKAGAASVVIDPSQTKERIKTMISIVGPGLILCAPSTVRLVSLITERKPFVVQKEAVSEPPEQRHNGCFETTLPLVKPSDLLYVVFTSGTTGNPKGAAITHANFTSAIKHQNKYLNFKPTARVAGFCSYAFDVSWSDFIHTLAAGACLCIPSEHDRKHDFIGYMNKSEVTFVHLTPSVAAILDLDNVPTLDTVALIGEVVDFDKLPQLRNIDTTIITYGPAECTVTTTGAINNGENTKATIGWALGSTTWIADPEKEALTPVGLVGELLLEGPLVGAGYLNNAEKTAAAFIENPSWLLRGGAGVEGRHGRLYRTGDLVRYTPDGEMVYVGRKDTQVKINGQRTELGDVEHHICRLLRSMPAVADIIAEVVTPNVTQRPMLVAFLLMPTTSPEQLRKKAAPIIEILEREMPGQVPPHMIPSTYIPMVDLPRGLTGKTDRRALREIGAKLDRKAFVSSYSTNSTQHIQPATEAELQLRDLWATVLNLPASEISAQDNFLRLGGDSIAAIRLATDLGRKGVWLTVPDIYRQPQLSEMAKLMSRSEAAVPEAVRPFSLLKAEIDKDDACRQVAELCSISAWPVEPSQIEDIFPCTALQEGLLAMTARSPGKYVGHHVAELKPEVNRARLQKAWQHVSERASILRTRIVDLPGQGLVQVVVDEALQWQTFSSLLEYRRWRNNISKGLRECAVESISMGLGTPLSHLAIIHDEAAGKRYLALTHHHATYDGWSVPLLQKDIEMAYRDGEAEQCSLPLQRFVKHIMNQRSEEGVAFWKGQFAEIEASPFPALPAKTYEPKPDKVLQHSIDSIRWPTCGVTPSSAIRTAWATLISWHVNSPDVAFGAVVSGRQAPVPGIEDVAGPTIATVPLRILVQGSVDELLHQVQNQAMEMIQFQQYGLQRIRQISQEAKYACDFQTLLLVHPSVKESTVESLVLKDGLNEEETGSGTENTFAMMLTCQTSESKLDMQLSYDSAVIQEAAAARLLRQLEHILDQIATVDGSTNIGDMSRVSERDLQEIWKWNAVVPESVEDCVHNVFVQRVVETPEAPAVCAWDGELTYAQLDRFSTLLANHLVGLELGIGPGAIVPLCFEKSVYVPVAILAVMKAGAASVALDTTLPHSRLESIVSQLSAKVVLTSKTCANLAAGITNAPAIEVGGDWDNFQRLFQQTPAPMMPKITPSSALYVVFTSGSTGTPKGAIITHANFCSAIRYHQPELGFEASSRVFDYTSYAFDVAWSNVLHALTVGACLCVPSEDERTADISGTINRLQANFIHLTPTVGRLLDPSALTSLKKVLFIGETLKASDVAKWETSGVEIYNTYGPAECTVTSTVGRVGTGDTSARISDPSIGKGTGALTWVVQPREPDRLAAIGTIGELWLEGPVVGAGYLNCPEKTASAFIEDPKWLMNGIPGRVPGRRGRVYKTGDLAFYNPDGSLGFVGRNDTQVKINGQRMELGEVEYHVRQLLPTEVVPQVVVDVITPDATRSQTLAVFLVMPDDSDSARVGLNGGTASMIATLRKELSKLLPSYMIPRAYIPIPLAELPMTATGKTDRQRVRELGRSYRPPTPSPSDALTSDAKLTKTEEALRDIWARLLGVKLDLIASDQSFSEVGGDSIKTMSLAMEIRKQFDVNVGVPRLVQQQNSLHELAALIDNLVGGQSVEEPMQPTPTDLEREIGMLISKIEFGRVDAGSTVFLTGSTGFLGTQILHYTLMKGAFDKVVLLVRSLDEQKGLDRVRETAKIAGWWKESFASSIEVWNGDLSAEGLGLEDSQWSALCGRPSVHGAVDAIIQNGARVHWATSYDGLKDVNVGSTIQLLQAAMASPLLKSFVYVSGGLITDSRTWTEEEARMSNGYDQTKYVSERLVSAAATQFRKRDTTFSVVKPGQIIGDVYTGVANADDFLWRVVMGAVRLGARPVESETSWLSVSDVRHVAEAILWHAAGKSRENFAHIKRGVWVSAFWSAVEDQLQLLLRPVSWREWIELAREDMAQEQEQHPLWPVQQFLGALGTEIEVSDHETYEWEMREVLAAARQNIAYLRCRGLLGTAGGKPFNGKIISRTRNVRTAGLKAVSV
ncbi:Nonribosomal Peptide Synthase (NRPS) [Arthroderma uncinatum]|uniref:Nonribosomal Peptide Synthase (NRPS) n=1 Tax=Arthroderma uncinatum TaxID=74035 RepID=UPI00144A8CF0|nr:Nonribosomal Peptide Synthase (NRPS) [Arthroderma uncinatum]KAF3492390.1 Nonribosomal Peptide Synthase (NRPS) [Arthroderma uncinatum]